MHGTFAIDKDLRRKACSWLEPTPCIPLRLNLRGEEELMQAETMVFEAVFFLEHEVTITTHLDSRKQSKGLAISATKTVLQLYEYSVPPQTSDLDQKWTMKTKKISQGVYYIGRKKTTSFLL